MAPQPHINIMPASAFTLAWLPRFQAGHSTQSIPSKARAIGSRFVCAISSAMFAAAGWKQRGKEEAAACLCSRARDGKGAHPGCWQQGGGEQPALTATGFGAGGCFRWASSRRGCRLTKGRLEACDYTVEAVNLCDVSWMWSMIGWSQVLAVGNLLLCWARRSWEGATLVGPSVHGILQSVCVCVCVAEWGWATD